MSKKHKKNKQKIQQVPAQEAVQDQQVETQNPLFVIIKKIVEDWEENYGAPLYMTEIYEIADCAIECLVTKCSIEGNKLTVEQVKEMVTGCSSIIIEEFFSCDDDLPTPTLENCTELVETIYVDYVRGLDENYDYDDDGLLDLFNILIFVMYQMLQVNCSRTLMQDVIAPPGTLLN